jgi:glycosyltransferase involved in cell wall biosynthesis
MVGRWSERATTERGAATETAEMPQRVLWCIKGLGPGGAENLLRAAAVAHDPARVALEIAYLLPWKDHLVADLEAAGVRCVCLGVRHEFDLRWVARLRARLRRDQVEVVHAHSPYVAAFVRLAVRSLPAGERPRMVTTEHNPWSTFKLPTRLMNAVTAGLDDATFAVSAETRRSMRRHVRNHTEVLVHGIDVSAASAHAGARAAVRRELGVADDTVVIGTVANYHPKKDWPNLLSAARAVADRGLRVRFVAVGQGPLESEVRALHSALDLGGVMTMTGYRPDAVRVIAGADVFALASRWEGLPVAVMEACALGLPIVATRVGGIAETFSDGVDALLVAPGDPVALADALERVVLDPDLRARLGTAAAARSSEFDVHRAVRRIEERYAELK